MPKVCHIDIQERTHIMRPYREAAAAADAGMEAVIICQGESSVEDGIEYIGFPKAKNRFDRFFSRSGKMIKAALDTNADIIQLHAPEYLVYALKLKRAGKKVIFDSHEDYPTQIKEKGYIPAPVRKMVSKLYAAYESYVCKRIDGVIYPSTIHGENRFEGRAKRTLKIENFSRIVPSFSPAEVKKRQVVYAGTLSEGRGVTQLARAIMRTDGELLLCGPFVTEDYREEIIRSFPASKVKYLGSLDRKELFKVYASCMVGASVLLPVGQYPNGDNLGTKVYEFMQCGIPAVISNFRPALAANDRWHFGVCVDPENVDEISNAIQYLFDHPDEARQMGENGRRAVEEEFNWAHEEKKLLAFYQEILSA